MQIDIPGKASGADDHDIIGMGQVQLPAFFAQGNPVLVGGLESLGNLASQFQRFPHRDPSESMPTNHSR